MSHFTLLLAADIDWKHLLIKSVLPSVGWIWCVRDAKTVVNTRHSRTSAFLCFFTDTRIIFRTRGADRLHSSSGPGIVASCSLSLQRQERRARCQNKEPVALLLLCCWHTPALSSNPTTRCNVSPLNSLHFSHPLSKSHLKLPRKDHRFNFESILSGGGHSLVPRWAGGHCSLWAVGRSGRAGSWRRQGTPTIQSTKPAQTVPYCYSKEVRERHTQ